MAPRLPGEMTTRPGWPGQGDQPSGESSPSDGSPRENSSRDRSPGDGTAGDGTAGDGTAGDGTAGDGTAGDGIAGTRVACAQRASRGQAGPVARVRGLARSFGGRPVLGGLDLDLRRGEFTALIGRSGSGKSTLLRALAGLDPDVSGELGVSATVAVAFQEPRLVPWKRVLPNVCLGLRVDDPKSAAAGALAEVGLTERADAWPLTLSGGEAQRASLARALVREPGLLLLDEPFGALDALTRISMHRLVLRLWAHHQPAVLLVTHDVDEAIALADRVIVLADGRIGYDCRVSLPRPRDRDHPELTARRARLLTELGVTMEGKR